MALPEGASRLDHFPVVAHEGALHSLRGILDKTHCIQHLSAPVQRDCHSGEDEETKDTFENGYHEKPASTLGRFISCHGISPQWR
jgi:hypothetical protein